jgi:hypothetical protein
VQASYTGAGFVRIADYLEPETYAIGWAAAMQCSGLRSTPYPHPTAAAPEPR